MVSANIGSAWISVVPETSKIAPELKKAIGSAEKSAGKTGSNIGSKISSGISKTLKVGAASVGVAAGGVLAASITKGLGRLSGIENAQAKLSGLGHEAEGVSSIMEDALVSVKGTAYGLEDAATVAASAVAAGVKPGKDLQRTLKLTGDAANIAGVDISAMGSIVNKVATSDMMQMDVANQLMDAGIPILQMVADEMGVTAEEARKLASDGKISFETFQAALEEGVGGAALKAGETVQGSFANMGAAAGRFGAALADPVFKAAPALFSAVGSVFDDINDAIGPAAERIGQLLTPALENVAELMESRVSPWLAQGAEKLGDFAVLLTEKAVDPSMWERVGEVFGSIRDTAERLWPSLESLAKSFFTIAQNISAATWEALGAALNAIAPLIESVLVPLVETVADIAEKNPKAVQALVLAFLGFKGVGAIAGPVGSAAKTIGGLGEAFSTTRALIGAGGVVEGVKELGKYSGDANPVLSKMGGGVASFGKKSGAASKFLSPLIKGIGTVIRFINPWVAGITVAVGALTWFFTKTELGQKVFGKLVEWVTVAWDKITEVFTAGVDWVVDKWGSFTGWLSGAWSGITSLFKGDFTSEMAEAFGLSDDSIIIVAFFKIRDAAVSAMNFLKASWEALGSAFSAVWEGVLKPVLDAVWTIFRTTIAVIGTIILTPLILAWNAWSWAIKTAWEEIIKPAWDAMGSALTWFWEAIAQPVIGWLGEKWNQLSLIWAAGVAYIRLKIDEFSQKIQELWVTYVSPVLTWIQDKWDQLKIAWGLGVDFIKVKISDFAAALVNFWNATVVVVIDWIKGKWTELQNHLSAVWQWIKVNVIDAFTNALRSFWENHVSPVIDFIKNKWQEMGDKLGAVWSWVDNNVFTPLKNGLDVVKGWFDTTVNAIGESWSWLREKTASPINFVIDTVYNKGIKRAWNAVAGLVGLDELNDIPLIGGFASGGVLPGYSPGVDNHMFYSPTGGRLALSGGEAIMRPEWTRAVGGPAAVDRMNAEARSGRLPKGEQQALRQSHSHALGGVLAFANGGVVDAMTRIVKQKYPAMVLTSGLRNSNDNHGRGLAGDFAWPGAFGPHPAQLSLANDIADTYPGSMELIYGPGFSRQIKNGSFVGDGGGSYGFYAGAGDHSNHVHWAMNTPPTMPFGGGVFEGGSDGGGGGIWQSITSMVKGLWDNIIDKISPYDGETGGPFGKLPGAWLSTVAEAAWNHIKSLADNIRQMVGGNSGSVDVSGISGPVVDQVEAVFAKHGFTGAEWDAAKWIIQKESNWSTTATNPSSGAFGLFQFNPMGGDTLGTYLPSRSTDPAVQGDAGARYIKDRYGTPTAAKAFWEQNGWYDKGGVLETGTTLVQNDTGKPEAVLNPWQWQVFNRAVESMPMLSESMKMVAKEIGGAFLGTDFGYSELAIVLRNEEWARAIVDGSAILGNISRDVGAALVPAARDAGEDYLAAQATSALDVVGLGGLVPIGLKAGEAAWDAYQASPVDVGFNGRSVVVEIEAESDDDLVRVRQLKDMADRVQGLEVKVNEKKRPVAASLTRGGAM